MTIRTIQFPKHGSASSINGADVQEANLPESLRSSSHEIG